MCCFLHKRSMKEKNTTVVYALAVIAVAFLAMNQLMIYNINGRSQGRTAVAGAVTSDNSAVKAAEAIIPKGVPLVYGQELGVSFDRPVESLSVLASLDGDLYEDGKLKLSDLNEIQKSRYMKIGMSIACEYCCGATSLVFNDGKPACGCAHSAAMRGLAKYLLINHPDMTDDQILEELTKWKIMFFPKQMIQKYMQQSGLAPAGAGLPEMVGGC